MIVFAVLVDKSGLTCLEEHEGRAWAGRSRAGRGPSVNAGIHAAAAGEQVPVEPSTVVDAEGQSTCGFVVVNKPEHQLPLFVIEFKHAGGPVDLGAAAMNFATMMPQAAPMSAAARAAATRTHLQSAAYLAARPSYLPAPAPMGGLRNGHTIG